MITYKLFEAGFCLHCERMTLNKGDFKQAQYPALCALVTHPTEGYILFDTGYSERFYELTATFPYSIYKNLTPVNITRSLKNQLSQQNIAPEEIRYIIISHFHADHIGGLRDFPNARFICHQDALADIQGKKGVKALLQGFLPDLLPEDFNERVMSISSSMPLPNSLSPFKYGFDIFGDNLLWAVPLPGHAKGQIGLFFNAEHPVFLVADSAYHSETLNSLHLPSMLTRLIHDDWEEYKQTIAQLNQMITDNPQYTLIPSHCIQHRPID